MCFAVYNPRDHCLQIWQQQISKANVSELKKEEKECKKRGYRALCKVNKHTQNQLLSDMYKDLVVLLKPNIFQDCQELIKTKGRKQ